MTLYTDKSKGYVIFQRTILDSPIWSNQKLFRLYFWIMLRANYKVTEVFPTTNKIILHPGQFITSFPHAAQELGMSVGSVKTYLEILQKEQIIEINSTNKYTVITIQNWSSLQNPEKKMNAKYKQSETDNTFNTNKLRKSNIAQDKSNLSVEQMLDLAGRLSQKHLANHKM